MIGPLIALVAAVQVIHPASAPGPLDNPLKGWCPYTIAGPLHQPYSMVFLYVPWKDLEPSEGRYLFDSWESKAWSTPLGRGRHVVIRVFIDYPGRPSGIPDWLIAKGVRTTRYSDYGGGLSPDYDDPRTVSALERFVAALGRRYDRNPRVAFVQFGLLGFWGEWHTYPRTELFASEATQRRILETAHRAFPNKVLMTRYPSGFAGSLPWIGYFDDSFPDDTDGSEEWKFLPTMRRSGRTENWKRAVIGGEMLPRQAAKWLGADYAATMRRLEDAHFSWVGPYCPAQEGESSPAFVARSQAMVRRMGYEFRLTEIVSPHTVRSGARLSVTVRGVNTGVAPFYYRWPVRLALIDARGRVTATTAVGADIRRWLPGPFREEWSVPVSVKAGRYRLALGILDPWSGRPAIRFANRLPTLRGWTAVADLRVTR